MSNYFKSVRDNIFIFIVYIAIIAFLLSLSIELLRLTRPLKIIGILGTIGSIWAIFKYPDFQKHWSYPNEWRVSINGNLLLPAAKTLRRKSNTWTGAKQDGNRFINSTVNLTDPAGECPETQWSIFKKTIDNQNSMFGRYNRCWE